MSNSFQSHGLYPTRLHPWDFPGKNTGVGCHFLLQGIFPTQGSNPGLPHCRQTFYCLSNQGSPPPPAKKKKKNIYIYFFLIFSSFPFYDQALGDWFYTSLLSSGVSKNLSYWSFDSRMACPSVSVIGS